MTKIYFVRHGKVQNNQNIFYGRLPRMGLAKIGREQVRLSAEFLKDKNIVKVFSSNLLRARQSADIISQTLSCTDVSRTDLISEIKSFMEGKPFDYGTLSRFDHYFSPLRKKGHDTMESVLTRMLKFLGKVEREHPNENLTAIGHGDPLMILKAHLNGLPMELNSIRPGLKKYVGYGEIYLVTINNSQIKIDSVFSPNY